jgi:hypothetical protein
MIDITQDLLESVRKRVMEATPVAGQVIRFETADGYFEYVQPPKVKKPWKRYKRKAK